MAEITENTEHLSQALSRLAEVLRNKPNLAALIGVYVEKVQELEGVFMDLFVLRSLENATGQQLDKLGAIVGQLRLGTTDETFRLYIQTRIRTNLSSGTAEELLSVFGPLIPTGTVVFTDQPPAGFTLSLTEVPTTENYAALLLGFLRAAKAGGVHGILQWNPTTEELGFTFDGGDGLGFGDSGDPLVGGELSGSLN